MLSQYKIVQFRKNYVNTKVTFLNRKCSNLTIIQNNFYLYRSYIVTPSILLIAITHNSGLIGEPRGARFISSREIVAY